MRFGGHQTFYVREGWLAKGLALLLEDASAFDDPFVADQLGVGRNMAKSIEHWLLATGLATKAERQRRPDRPRLKATELGKIIAKHDPWFLDPGTWWFYISISCALRRMPRLGTGSSITTLQADSNGQRSWHSLSNTSGCVRSGCPRPRRWSVT